MLYLLYLIPADVFTGNPTAVGINLSYLELYSPLMTTTMEFGNENNQLYCKANGLAGDLNKIVFPFWFDSNKGLQYPFLGSRVIRGWRFSNDL